MMSVPCFNDVHAHLQDQRFEGELDQIIKNAENAGIKKIINSTSNLSEAESVISIAEKYDCCYAMIGIHPEDADKFDSNSIHKIMEYMDHPKVLGIGEIGLDFHYPDGLSQELQIDVFRQQMALAAKLNVPVELHIRDAYGVFFDALQGIELPEKKLLHCYSGSLEIAERAIKMGFDFSIGGVLTFPNSKKAVKVFTSIPIEKLHLETDCPYLAPQAKRGKRNEPAYASYTAQFLADIRGLSLTDLSEVLMENDTSFFGGKLK